MKGLIISALVLIYSASSFACSCVTPNYNSQDMNDAILSFMKDKLGVEEQEVREMKSLKFRTYLSPAQRLAVAPFIPVLYLSDKEVRKKGLKYSCDYNCILGMSSDRDMQIKFMREEKNCTVNLRVIMISSLIGSGFKSKVKQKDAPVCN